MGYAVSYLSPDENGLLDVTQLADAIRDDTILVSIMHVNNETGVIQDIAAIADITASHGVLLHVDAAQSAGKLPVNVAKMPIDLLSLSAHKVYGPQGIGALYLRKKPRVRVAPLLHGGGHEQGMRSGTLPVHQIAGMGEAFRLAYAEMDADRKHITALHDYFLQGISVLPKVKINGDLKHKVPHILNFRLIGMFAEAVLAKLPMIATSTASACAGKGTEGSYVLRAMGMNTEEAKSALRFSFGRFTQQHEVQEAVEALLQLLV